MEHIAIDLGGRDSQVCIRRSDGTIVDERRIETAGLARFFTTIPSSRVLVETCAESFGVADAAIAAGHEVRVVPASLIRSLGVGARRIKTDRRDAQALSEASCRMDLPSVHIPSVEARRKRSLCAMRAALVRSRTLLVNTVRGWLRTNGLSIRATPETLPARVRERGGGAVPEHVMRTLHSIAELTTQIRQGDRELFEIARADDVCRRLMTVPGVGPITAVLFQSTVDDQQRFGGAHLVEAYLGLVPGEHSSSGRQRRLSITKAGSDVVRTSLVQAAWSARRTRRADPMVQWSIEVERRRGQKIAIVALARKLAGILFALWRDGGVYDPRRGAETPSTI